VACDLPVRSGGLTPSSMGINTHRARFSSPNLVETQKIIAKSAGLGEPPFRGSRNLCQSTWPWRFVESAESCENLPSIPMYGAELKKWSDITLSN
jgi:hypothetical protein